MNKDEHVKSDGEGRVICPRCGTRTNRHAEKPDYSADPAGPGFDPILGAALMEFHTCPGCRYVVERGARS